jgi:phosphoribosyl 1,2-cyclic phosphodiesterase
MELKVINSGSSGNAYLLGTKDSALLIECGVKFQQIKEASDFNLLSIVGCVVTHEHLDHSKSVRQVMQCGIPIATSRGTYEALKLTEDLKDFEIGHAQSVWISRSWKVSALSVEHDAREPLAFLIENDLCGRVLFITDTYIFRYKIPKVDHLIIEANYDETIVDELTKSKGTDYVNSRRFKSHMSFQTAIETIDRLDRSNLKNIVLIHLSDQVSNEKKFKEETEQRFGIPTTVATSGQIINFSKTPF